MRPLLFALCAALPAYSAPAQSAQPVSPASCWLFGAKLGVSAFQWHNARLNSNGSLLRPTAALNAGRYVAAARLSLHAEALVEQRYHFTQRPLYVLLPLYLRTGMPTGRFHMVLGGGWGRQLGSGSPRLNEKHHPNEAFGTLGLEVGVGRQATRHAASLGLYYRRGTTGYTYYSYSPGGQYFADAKDQPQSLSLTLNYFLLR
ncbi:hypothetical protein [Hymenobacter jeollabukensis]|uniref:PorT family protein n=1 Tax=Hymenobacter jeollabukensis TaxID=2025313 RepID=A0A5R8WS83_9BACT|nr:hypothetical protein [Hymenobacter jeollabukensis]TLM94043.1 hypothetical protein FDY95_08430 [Hymenobacter jeollabukensis]